MIKFNLRVLMAKKDINQTKLHEATGINKDTIGRYYHNTTKRITLEHLDILCKFFDCKIEDLLEYTKE